MDQFFSLLQDISNTVSPQKGYKYIYQHDLLQVCMNLLSNGSEVVTHTHTHTPFPAAWQEEGVHLFLTRNLAADRDAISKNRSDEVRRWEQGGDGGWR